MHKTIIGLAAGALLALGFPAPAAAAIDPISFSFTDRCGTVETAVTNNSTSTVQYTLAMTYLDVAEPLGKVDFSLEAGQTRTHRWMVLTNNAVRATSPALAGPIDFTPGPGCVNTQPEPFFLPDCKGGGLAETVGIFNRNAGEPVFAVNGKPGKPFPPGGRHQEILTGLKPGDRIAFMLPALSEPHELVTWKVWTYQVSSKCSHLPPVTLTATCTGVNVKTVNTQAKSNLSVAFGSDSKLYPLEQGASLDEVLPMTSGIAWAMWHQGWDQTPGDPPAVALLDYARPQDCDNSPSPSPAPPANGGEQMPVTGAPTWLLLSAGGLMLLLGGALLMLTRGRRRA